jgi:hypothetical protein
MAGIQRLVQLFGVLLVLVALLGFLASGSSMEAQMDHAARILGLFPVDLPHNLAHLSFGLWGLVAAHRWSHARVYARISSALYLLLAFTGFFHPTVGNLMPVGGHNIILHASLGAILTLFGLLASSPEPEEQKRVLFPAEQSFAGVEGRGILSAQPLILVSALRP